VELVAGVDRKSNDKTYDIVSKYADVLFRFDFKDDFSQVRNELIKRSSGDWILVADGHELFFDIEKISQLILDCPANVEAFAFLLEMSPAEGGTIGQQVRLFKNDVNRIYYEGSVHNKLTIDTTADSYATDLIKIYHDRPKSKRAERYPQRKKMITEKFLKALEANPEDARANFYVGTYYLSTSIEKDDSGAITDGRNVDKKVLSKSIPYLEKYIEVSDFYEEKYLAKWYLAQAYYHLGDVKKTKEIAYDMFEQMHELPLAQEMLGEIFLKDGLQNKDNRSIGLAEFWFQNSRNKKIPFVSCFFPKAFFTYLPWDRLTEIYSQIGRLTDAIIAGEELIKFPDYPQDKRKEINKCLAEWKQLYQEKTGINLNENSNRSRSGDRQFSNVHAIDNGDKQTVQN